MSLLEQFYEMKQRESVSFLGESYLVESFNWETAISNAYSFIQKSGITITDKIKEKVTDAKEQAIKLGARFQTLAWTISEFERQIHLLISKLKTANV